MISERNLQFLSRLIFLRFLLAIIIVFFISKQKPLLAGFFFVVVALLSVIESFIKRRMQGISQRRIVLDAIADKFVVNILALSLAVIHVIPWWFPAILIGRDIITLIGAAYAIYRHRQNEFKPKAISKMALFFQMIALFAVITGNAEMMLLAITAAITLISSGEALVLSEFQKIRERERLKPYSFIAIITLADLISLLNAVFGVMSILFAISGRFSMAAIMMVLAVIADVLDGRVARMRNTQHEFGREIDSLADTVSFGVAPAVFAFSLIDTTLAIIAFTVFVFCGILRLARYNVLSPASGKTEEYRGMPITLNGIIIPVVYFVGISELWYPYLFLFLGFLMVSSLRIKKF